MEKKGGIRIGWYGASSPLVTLRATANELRIKILASSEYIFSPSQVVSLEIVGSIPFLTKGIKIKHTIKDYPENIIFYCLGSADNLLKDIYYEGFKPQGTLAVAPRRSGFPVKWPIIILLIALWNGLFYLDTFKNPTNTPGSPGPLSLLAIFTFFIVSIALQKSKRVQSLFLRPERSIKEIEHIVSLFTLVTGMLSIVFGLMTLIELFKN